MRRKSLIWLIITVLAAGATAAVEPPTERRVRLIEADPEAPLPADLLRPEGRTRWDLTSLAPGAERTRSARPGPEPATVVVDGETRYSDALGDGAAARWLFPDRDPVLVKRPGETALLVIDEQRSGSVDRLRIETRRAGIGWVHLPSGPREVLLQRALVSRRRAGERAFVAESLIHRWVDPRAGVVAEVAGPVSLDGTARLDVTSVSYVDEVLAGAADLKIYVDELEQPAFRDLLVGWNRREVCASGASEGNACTQESDCTGATNNCGAWVSSLTPDAYATIGALVAADTWDFSGTTTGTEQNSTAVPVDATETCNTARCGYTPVGARVLGRRDEELGGGQRYVNNQVTERTDDVVEGATIWLRAGAQREDRGGLFGGGESSFCFVSAKGCNDDPGLVCDTNQDCTDAGRSGPCVQFDRPENPLWRFPHQDAGGWYMQALDSWESPVFTCDQVFYNRRCGAPGLFADDLWAKACSDHLGKQSIEVQKGGVVTLPSGHTLNALLVKNVMDTCIYSGDDCDDGLFGNKVDEVRTVIYMWQVPHLGTVILLQSAQEVPDATSFDKLAATYISYGLFPPLAIQVDGVTDTTLDLSWDPGNDTHRIQDYVVYWDTDSGAADDYACNSLSLPCGDGSTLTFTGAGTSATLSGLQPGTTYFVTVTSRSAYTDPLSTVTTTYESIRYPTQVSGDPDKIYPVEVQGTTTGGACTPTVEVQNLVIDKPEGGGCEICWDAAVDPCLTGYRVLGADTPESDAGFTEVAQVGLTTCWSGSPTETFFLVVATGSGGDGPWGHYGR